MIGCNFGWKYRNVEARPHDELFFPKKYILIYLTSCQSLKRRKEKYLNKSHGTSLFHPFFFSSWRWTTYLVDIFSLILIDYHVPCSKISLASDICSLIFIGSLLSDYKLLVIGQFWSYSNKIKLYIWAVKNQSDSSILLTQLISG